MTQERIIKCHKIHLIERCEERGVKLEDAMQSVVHKEGDIYEVDVLHPAYPKPNGLGDRIEKVLKGVGITSNRVSKLIGKPCGCAERKKRLNELGKRFGIK